jgi:indole-3-glycerol phosphate synthase
MYQQTDSYLDTILETKAREVAQTLEAMPPAAFDRLNAEAEQAARQRTPIRDFAAALWRGPHLALIAEIKKASPSKGILIEAFDAAELAETYAGNGAAAISVLTDHTYFQGSFANLRLARARAGDVPLLCKEFIVHEVQVAQAAVHGADAVLLIVAALTDERLRALADCIAGYGMTALVEVHDAGEVQRALDAGARVLGVNNRDLRTFAEDLSNTERLARLIPAGCVLVAESAMRTVQDARRMADAGADAILIGEGLIRAPDTAAQVRAFSGVPRMGGRR